MDVLLLQFGTQRAKLLVLLDELSVEGLDGLLHLLTLEARRAELLLQLLDQIAVLLHTLGDKLDILLDHGRLVTTFAILRHRHTVFGLVDLGKALLNLVQRTHHIIDLIITSRDNRTQRVVLDLLRANSRFLVLIASGQRQHAGGNKK